MSEQDTHDDWKTRAEEARRKLDEKLRSLPEEERALDEVLQGLRLRFVQKVGQAGK